MSRSSSAATTPSDARAPRVTLPASISRDSQRSSASRRGARDLGAGGDAAARRGRAGFIQAISRVDADHRAIHLKLDVGVAPAAMPPLDTKSLLGCQRFSSVAADTAMAAITLFMPLVSEHEVLKVNGL
jgi:hypothetical protein